MVSVEEAGLKDCVDNVLLRSNMFKGISTELINLSELIDDVDVTRSLTRKCVSREVSFSCNFVVVLVRTRWFILLVVESVLWGSD